MSKLIGTNPNQVPSNADLGTAAFMDKKEFLLSKGSEMSAIDAVIPKTALDVFVYDTTKDSDGGAWRKRVQHTSWYNERLNTTTRGSRKEFPVIAVIVVESAYVTIYDGDDPALPMWMGFPDASYAGHLWENAPSCVHALNAKIAVGSTPYDLNVVDFIADKAVSYSSSSVISGTHKFPISGRAPATGSYSSPADVWEYNTGVGNIIDRYVNDVTMTVLPNAPIDASTGLPVPTIAVATNGGVSVIKDDGTVIDYTGSAPYNIATLVNFTKDGRIRMALESASQRYYRTFNIGSSDKVINQWDPTADDGLTLYLNYANGDAVMLGSPVLNATEKAVSSSTGLTFFEENITVPKQSLVSHATSSYNTGWMHGDIKLATLSDTDAGYISASNNTNLLSGGWTNNGSFPYETFTTSGLDITSAINTTAYGAANKTWTATAGKTYTAYFNLTLNSGTAPTLFVQASSSWGNGVSYQTVNGVNAFTFTATTSVSSFFSFSVSNGVASNFAVSNLELYEGGVADRSFNNPSSGLSVFGTVTKTPVAPGAELMGYSGFSSSNYLRQAYNTNLNFGTGSYSVMGWIKTASTTALGMVTQHGPSDADENLCVYISPSNYGIYFDYGAGGEYCYLSQSADRSAIANTKWHHFVCHVSAGGPPKIYVNGISRDLTISANGPSTFRFDTDYVLNVGTGRGTDNSLPFDGSISLLRISGTVPTPEQIKKIYNDEKALFQENAKATLYGTSDAVTALAYDDDTELLHAGTSAGRSDFQGLRRINNTTRAIGAAISAVDGFIVEE